MTTKKALKLATIALTKMATELEDKEKTKAAMDYFEAIEVLGTTLNK